METDSSWRLAANSLFGRYLFLLAAVGIAVEIVASVMGTGTLARSSTRPGLLKPIYIGFVVLLGLRLVDQ